MTKYLTTTIEFGVLIGALNTHLSVLVLMKKYLTATIEL